MEHIWVDSSISHQLDPSNVTSIVCVIETDCPNVVPWRCECDGCCPLMDMGRGAARIREEIDRRWPLWLKCQVDWPSGAGAITAAAQHPES
eukprot:scaffold34404_cov38-Cyclotella_meneghiniana.AAC.1